MATQAEGVRTLPGLGAFPENNLQCLPPRLHAKLRCPPTSEDPGSLGIGKAVGKIPRTVDRVDRVQVTSPQRKVAEPVAGPSTKIHCSPCSFWKYPT